MSASKKMILATDVLKDATASAARAEVAAQIGGYPERKDSPTSIKRRLVYVRQLCLDAMNELDEEG